MSGRTQPTMVLLYAMFPCKISLWKRFKTLFPLRDIDDQRIFYSYWAKTHFGLLLEIVYITLIKICFWLLGK